MNAELNGKLNKFKEELCPVCRREMHYLYTIERFRPNFRIYECPVCRLQKKETTDNDDSKYYNEDYYAGKSEYSYIDERKQNSFHAHVWKARLKNISKFIPPPADFLDAGCSFGGFALQAKEMGYRANGLDVSEYAAEHAQKNGLKTIQGKIKSGIFPDDSFDIVTMIEVMEHVSNPDETLSALSKMIRPGGLLVIQTANFAGMQAKREKEKYHYYLPGHLYYYSRKNLTELLKKHKFSRVKFYPGVDFSLIAKLLKSRGNFHSLLDYLKWFSISWYHLKSKIAFGNFALTSSMVLYAFRDENQ